VRLTAEWLIQQLRETFPDAGSFRYAILDWDSKFNADVSAFLKATGWEPRRTSVQAPWQNGIAERWVGSCRREILDHVTFFRDDEAELLEFTVDLGGSQVQVLIRQASDECATLLADLWSTSPRSGTPSPVKAETGAVPADNSLGRHDDEDIAPAGPTTAESRPEEAVPGIQKRPRSITFQYGDLLPEGEDFECRVAPTPEEDADHGEDGQDEFGHEPTLVSR
jgi:hypothetical protein